MDYYKSNLEENKFNVKFALYFAASIVLSVYVKLALGIAIGVVIAVLLTYKCGIEIDQTKRTFRSFVSVLGYTFGEWRILPENIEYIAVVKVLSAGYDSKYKLNFVVKDSRRFVNLRTLREKVAFKEALNIGDAFNLRVCDFTSHDKKWIR